MGERIYAGKDGCGKEWMWEKMGRRWMGRWRGWVGSGDAWTGWSRPCVGGHVIAKLPLEALELLLRAKERMWERAMSVWPGSLAPWTNSIALERGAESSYLA